MSAVRAALRLLTVLVAGGTALVALGPRSIVVDGRDSVAAWLMPHPRLGALVAGLGGLEPAGNLVLFLPVAALLAASLPLRSLPPVLVLLALAPPAVEQVQRFLPGRVPDGADVVRNTVGLLVGFGVVALLRGAARLLAPQPRSRRLASAGPG